MNISFSQIQDDRVCRGRQGHHQAQRQADASRLEFELTETTILKEPRGSERPGWIELRLLGISFSLDDFGTGFSQLSHLTELPISALKVDKPASCARCLATPHQAAVCAMIIEMARRLGMAVSGRGRRNPRAE